MALCDAAFCGLVVPALRFWPKNHHCTQLLTRELPSRLIGQDEPNDIQKSTEGNINSASSIWRLGYLALTVCLKHLFAVFNTRKYALVRRLSNGKFTWDPLHVFHCTRFHYTRLCAILQWKLNCVLVERKCQNQLGSRVQYRGMKIGLMSRKTPSRSYIKFCQSHVQRETMVLGFCFFHTRAREDCTLATSGSAQTLPYWAERINRKMSRKQLNTFSSGTLGCLQNALGTSLIFKLW